MLKGWLQKKKKTMMMTGEGIGPGGIGTRDGVGGLL